MLSSGDDSNPSLESKVKTLQRELTESLQQQAATFEVLRVISNSPGNLEAVFYTMLENATRICEAKFGTMFLYEDGAFRPVALHGAPPAFAEKRRREGSIRPGPDNSLGRLANTKQVVHVEDITKEPAYAAGDPVRRALADLAGARTLVAVPMLKSDSLVGAIVIYRQEARRFS